MQIIAYITICEFDISSYYITAFIPLVVENIIKEIVNRIKFRKHYFILQDLKKNKYYCKPWKVMKVLKKQTLVRATIPDEYKSLSMHGVYPIEVVRALNAQEVK